MIKAGIIGAAGYAGITLTSILLRHPEAEIVWIISEPAHKGKKLSDLYPHLKGEIDLKCQELDLKDKLGKVDLVFLALPNAMAMKYVPEICAAGKKAIDLSADYRFPDQKVFKKWYQVDHASPESLKDSVYGLPELHKEKIKKSKIIGNPGCYPTASILGLAPLIREKLIDLENIIVDAKSGVSGAGRGLSLTTHFSEVNEGMAAYAIGTHRHTPEIEQELSGLAGKEIKVSFTPHLTPMTRGILATIYANPLKKVSAEELNALYQNFYKEAPFVRVVDNSPATKQVYGTNFCHISLKYDERVNRIIILSVIDNLVKGAAGQAVQNMNLMYGCDEKTGLKAIGLYP